MGIFGVAYIVAVFAVFIFLAVASVITIFSRKSNIVSKMIAGLYIPFGIFVIFYILIPPFLSGRISANETSAIGTLKQLASNEAIWQQQDPDRNGTRDFWTYDVSCLYRIYRPDGENKTAFIPLDNARADAKPAPYGQKDFFGNLPQIEIWDIITPQLKSGYFFRAMLTDENGIVYNQNSVGSNKILATNAKKFAFVAYPDKYGLSGYNTFIVNETGIIYANETDDRDDNVAKIVLHWSGLDPTKVKGPSGRYWKIAE